MKRKLEPKRFVHAGCVFLIRVLFPPAGGAEGGGGGAASVPMSGVAEDDGDDEEGADSPDEGAEWVMCSPARHKWARENCMVCTVCHECTGYGAACVSSGKPNRSPAM